MIEYGVFTDEGCIDRDYYDPAIAAEVATNISAEADETGYAHVGAMCGCGEDDCECEAGDCDCETDEDEEA